MSATAIQKDFDKKDETSEKTSPEFSKTTKDELRSEYKQH